MPKKEKVGRVISIKMANTAVVEVVQFKAHPKYKKIIATTKHYMADTQNCSCNNGDEVKLIESRPISKTKRWIVAEVLKQAT